MYMLLPLWLAVIGTSLIKAAPHKRTELNATPLSKYSIYFKPHPEPDPYNPEANNFSVEPPTTAAGIGFILILESSNSGCNNASSEHFNVIIGFFKGVEETSSDTMEVLVRKAQTLLKPNENFHDGQLESLLRELGTVRIYKSCEGMKDILLSSTDSSKAIE